MRDLLSTIDLYDDDTSGMADGGRIGFKDGPTGKFTEKGITGPQGGRPIPDHVIMANDRLALKEARKKIDKLNRVNKLDGKGVRFVINKTQAGNFTTGLSYTAEPYRKTIDRTLSTGPIEKLKKEFNQFKKTDLFKNYSKSAAMQAGGVKSAKTQLKDIGSKKEDIFNYLLNNKNATIEQIAKDLKIKDGVVRTSLQGLYTDIYKRVGDQGAAYLKDFNSGQLESVHGSIKNTKVRLKDRVKNLVIDAYKGDKNLKPLLEKLDNFYTLQNEIKKTSYGKFFAANLDHPVPLNFIRQLEEGADPFNLIRIKPVPEFLNQRAFKAQFDRVLGTAYKTGNKKALEAIVNLQSYLPQEFGGITKTGKIIDYGAKPFNLKTDLSQTNFPEVYKRVFNFIKNPELQDTFKEAKVSFKSLIGQEKNIINQSSGFLQKLAAIGCPGKMMGGRIGFFEGQNLNACAAKGMQKLQTTDPKNLTPGDKANIKSITKTVQGGRILKNILGPGALAFEALFALPFATYDFVRGRPGMDTLKSAASLGFLDQKLTDAELKKINPEYGISENLKNVGDSLTNLERLQKGTKGQRIRSKGKFKIAEQKFENALQELEKTDSFKETGDLEKAYLENIKKSQEAEQELDRQYKETAEGRTTKFDLSDPFMAAGGGIAKEAGDSSGPPPESGPMSQGLPGLLKRVRNL